MKPLITWSMLHCDIHLGNSTAQFLTYHKNNSTETVFVEALKKALAYKAKTKPTKMARRLGCLIGLTYDKLNGDSYILNCIITAFTQLEQEMT